MTAKLSGILSGFPSEEHVQTVCKPGQGEKTCRYLAVGSAGWSCEKAGSMRRMLDERVAKGDMHAQGDNCGGILEVILEHKETLRGKRTEYEESMPSIELNGTLKDVKVRSGMVYIIADWNNRGEDTFSYSVNDLDLIVTARSITFGIAGLGSFVGRTTILLD